jgi:phosphonoacetaldehyde hydrolase
MKTNDSPPRYTGSLKGVIFDWAGTVIDYGSCAPAAAFVQVFGDDGVEITTAEAREPMGMAKRTHIATILKMPAVRTRWQEAHGSPPEETDIERLYGKFIPTQLDCLQEHSQLIPGTVEMIAACRKRGLKIGSSTGYTRALMDVVMKTAAQQGFEPDCMLCADDVTEGRPAPWLCFENARRLGIFPTAAVVKVDDTTVGIEAGRNAGMWTIGITKSGNLVGETLADIEQIDANELRRRIDAAEEKMFDAGAHYAVESVADLTAVLDAIETRLSAGESP